MLGSALRSGVDHALGPTASWATKAAQTEHEPTTTDFLSRSIGELLQQRSLTLAVAESCTGGLLGAYITDVSGRSAYFEGGLIAYSNAIKVHILGVPATALQRYGAVSRETAIAMARAARRLLRTDLALSVTGVAGPTGGTPEKPVGLVYVALTSKQGAQCKEFRWNGDRRQNREWSARAALEMLRTHLLSGGSV
jgi:PncC family amidohydrolase